jgi:hypothetical protein
MMVDNVLYLKNLSLLVLDCVVVDVELDEMGKQRVEMCVEPQQNNLQ